MIDDTNTGISKESNFSSALKGDGSISASQSASGSYAEITSVVVICEKNGSPISARHFNIKKGENKKLSLGAEMLASMPDRVIFDIKVTSSAPVNDSGFGGLFTLGDPPVIFNVPPNSPLTALEMMSMVGANQSRGLVTITLSPIWRRGYFPFTMAINLVDPSTPGRVSSVPKSVLEIYTEPRAGNFFDSLDVEVREQNGNKYLSIIENRREEIQEIFRTESADVGFCLKPCVYHTAEINKVLDDSGNVKDVDLDIKASLNIAPSYPGFIIEDGNFGRPIVSSHSYRGNSFRHVSNISMSMYNFNNKDYAYDQLVSKKLVCVGTNENRPHPLIDISDPFACIETFKDSSINLLEFRNDKYTLSSEADSFSDRIPYLFYINAGGIRASNKIVSAINFTSKISSTPVSVSIQVMSENGHPVRRMNDVGLVFTTKIGSGYNERSFTNYIRVKTRSDNDPYGHHKTYGSGKSLPDQGWPHYDVTIGDLFDLINKNIAGTIEGNTSENIDVSSSEGYKGGQSSNGLFPTFSECGIPSINPNDPIIRVENGEHLSACYGLPAHRIWLGNTDGSNTDALTESPSSYMTNLQGSPFAILYCRGPEKSFSLENFTIAMPLARGSSRAFMRSEIKEYLEHASDGDFENLRANRFYPLRSMADAVEFIRFGSEYYCKKIGIKTDHIKYMSPSGLTIGSRLNGELRPCIGTSNIGISVNFSHQSLFVPDLFFKEIGSYFISAISQTEPFRMGPASMSTSAYKMSRNKDGISYLCYSPGRMFSSPLRGLSVSSERETNTNSSPTVGSEWHVLYSTLINDYFGGIKYKDFGISGYAALDPFIHDARASLKSEGGLNGSSKRKVYINTCIDFGGSAVRPTYNNVGYDLDDFCVSTGRYSGNVQRFVKSELNGSIGIPVSGRIDADAKISSSYPFDQFSVYENGNLVGSYENTFGNILETINNSFGWGLQSNPTSALAREDKVPFDLLRLELIERPAPPVEPPTPEPYFPYSPYEDYLQPYSSNVSVFNINSFKSYSPVIPKIFEPYYSFSDQPYEPYEPYISPSYYYNSSIFLRSSRIDKTSCNLGYIVAVSISQIIKDARYFDFNLSDRKNRTIANLIQSVEDRLGAFGIHARSAVSNPNSYYSSRIEPRSRGNILETEISTISEIDIITTPIEPPVSGPIEYDYRMRMFRYIDSDVYGYIIQRCDDANSIDDRYPFFPYTYNNSLINCGDLLENILLMQNVNAWGTNYAGKVFMGGAMGQLPDVQGKTFGSEGSEERAFSYNVSSYPRAITSLYDIGDTARRSFPPTTPQLSEINKYQWFDFSTNSVKGSNRYSVAAGYGGSTFISQGHLKLDIPRTGYTTTPGSASVLYDLIISNPNIWQLERLNPELIDGRDSFNIAFSFGSCDNDECINENVTNVEKVFAGNGMTIAIRKDGSLAYYGNPRTGNGLIGSVPAGNDFIDISVGGTFENPFGIACRSNGSTIMWGFPAEGSSIFEDMETAVGSALITQVSSGINHAVALADDGSVICWGDNSYNQCQVPSGMGAIVQISAAQYYTMALNSNGDVYVWGNGNPGDEIYLGVKNIPSIVSAHSGFDITKISAGESFAMALGSNGVVYCWGLNDYGQCNVPSDIQGHVLDIDAGDKHAIAITKKDSFISSWGYNYYGQCDIASSVFEKPSQTPYSISAGYGHSVILTNGGKKAPIRGLINNDLDADGIDEINPSERIQLLSIDQSVDSICVTLDTLGTVRIINTADQTPMGSGSFDQAWDQLIYFDEEWIANGFLTDDTGEPVFIENRDFVSVCATSGLLGLPEYVWCLHKNGNLYGVELLSARSKKNNRNNVGKYFGKRKKFNSSEDPNSGRSGNFGKAIGIREIDGYEYDDTGESATQFEPLSDTYGKIFDNLGNPTENGYCKDIAHALNFIPKINGKRFPVISVMGGYHTGGIAVCVDPNYTGYVPTESDNFNHPVQMCEIVKLQDLITSSEGIRRTTQRIQRYKAIYDSLSDSWSYALNNSESLGDNSFGSSSSSSSSFIPSYFDQELYDSIFGIKIIKNGIEKLAYVPPRCVSYGRSLGAGIGGVVSIMGNNGNYAILIDSYVFVPCYFDPATNSNYSEEFNNSKVIMRGDFSATQDEFDYNSIGKSPIFNAGTVVYNKIANYKFLNNPEGEDPGAELFATLPNFDPGSMFAPAHFQANIHYGWGNPPFSYLDPIYTNVYNIKLNGTANNVYGFSYYDNFGNDQNKLPSYMLREKNFINNDHIFKVIAYPDNNGNLPINENGTKNNSYSFVDGCIWNVLSICDHEKIDNPFVWIRAVGDGLFGIRMDGTIDIVGGRSNDRDNFIFDPFWDSPWPVGRLSPSGVPYELLRPGDYKTRTEGMRKIGSYYELDPYQSLGNFGNKLAYSSSDPYDNPYVVNYVQTYTSKPKPVFNVTNGVATIDVTIDVIDPSYSGVLALDFDFDVVRRSTPSNAAPEGSANAEQRPRNDPAVKTLITGKPISPNENIISSSQSINASRAPSEIAGEKTSADRYNQVNASLQEEYDKKMRRGS